jgi:predicted unusual protein kinase regulating ubiquinone biosynthesis (AarF/ABC1/UbiB family)
MGQRFVLSFVDFGMVGHIEQLTGQNLRRVLVSITRRDARGLTEAYNDLGFFLPGSDLERIAEAQRRLLDQLWGRNLMQLANPDPREIQEIGHEFRDLLFEFPFQIPQDFIFLGRTMGILSGLSSVLNPQINPWHLIERYGREFVTGGDRFDFSREALLRTAQTYLALPGQLQRVLAAAEDGSLRVRSSPDRTLMRRLDQIERRVGRPNWSLVAAALIVSGTLLYLDGRLLPAVAALALALILLLLSWLRRD